MGNLYDFDIDVPATNFSKRGVYSYIFQCNKTNVGGALGEQFTVTKNGYAPASDNLKIFIHLLFILAIIGLFYSFLLGIAKLATSETTVYDVVVSWSFYILMIIVNYLGMEYLLATYIEDLSATFLTITVWTNGVLPLISLIIAFFVRSFQKKKLLSVRELGGIRITS